MKLLILLFSSFLIQSCGGGNIKVITQSVCANKSIPENLKKTITIEELSVIILNDKKFISKVIKNNGVLSKYALKHKQLVKYYKNCEGNK